MPLSPQAMQSIRSGPAMGPQPNPTGAGADPGNPIGAAIAQQLNQQRTADPGFAGKTVEQMMRVCAALTLHLTTSDPVSAKHINRAWASLEQAKKAMTDNAKNQSTQVGPPLGFSGAGMQMTEPNPQ